MSTRLAAWRGPQGMAALGVLAVMLVTRGVLLHDSFFNQDDFYLSGRAYGVRLDADFLLRDTAGHVNPLQQLAYWLVANHAPYDWAVVAGFVLALQAGTTVMMWLLLTRLLGGRWSRVVLLAVFAWAPLTLATTLWWSAAMGLWPHLLCSVVAMWLLVRWQQDDSRGWVACLGIVLVAAVGLLWHERAVLIVPMVFGTAVCLADDAVGWRRPVAAIRRFWTLWVVLALCLAGFLVAHGALTDVAGGHASLRQYAEVSWSFLGRNVVPGLLGGPWTGRVHGGAVRPAAWSVVVALVVTLAVLVVVLLRGGPARRWALALLAGYVVADLALLLSGRAGYGAVIGLDPRYSSDTLHAAVVAAALALRGSPPWLGLRALDGRVRRPAAVVTALTGYAVASACGTALLVPHFQNVEDRRFLTNLRGDLAADPNRVMFDRLAPAGVVLPLVGEDSRLSRILAPLPEDPAFDQPSTRLRVVDEDGHLRPAALDDSVRARPGPDGPCGYEVGGLTQVVQFPVGLDGRVVVQVSYFSGEESTVFVSAHGWSTRFLAHRGPNEVSLVLPDLAGLVHALDLDGDARAHVCVTGVRAGLPEKP